MNSELVCSSNLVSDEEDDDTLFTKIDGIWWIREWGLSSLRFALSYQSQPNDLFIVAYPRSGTTWMQNIVYNLQTDGKPFNENIEHFFQQNPHLETDGKIGLNRMQKKSGAIKTHLPINRISYNEQAKYICIIRNPNDVCVSYYLLYNMWSDVPKLEFNQFFEHFIEETLPFNGYFQALQSVWQYKDYKNVLLVSYEEMRTDFQSVISKIANFLNIVLDNQLFEKVKSYSSFEYMKENFDNERRRFEGKFIENIQNEIIAARRKEIFDAESQLKTIQKGRINNWKSLMTSEQNQRMYQKFLLTCQECDQLHDYWSKWNIFQS